VYDLHLLAAVLTAGMWQSFSIDPAGYADSELLRI